MKRLVVVGNGMAGMACVEQILKYAPQFHITVFGDETHVNYNRVHALVGARRREGRPTTSSSTPLEWYQPQRASTCASACASSTSIRARRP